MNLPSLSNFRTRVVRRRRVPSDDEDVAVRRDDDVVRLIEVVGRGRAARLAERHQQLAVGAELEDLMAFRRAGARTDRAAACRRGRAPRARRGALS